MVVFFLAVRQFKHSGNQHNFETLLRWWWKKKIERRFNHVWSSGCYLRTEVYVNAKSEPGVVKSWSQGFHWHGVNPQFQDLKTNILKYLSAPFLENVKKGYEAPPSYTCEQVSLNQALLAGNGACYQTMSKLLWVAKSTVCSTVHKFCGAVRYVLMPEYIKLPWRDDPTQVIEDFREGGSHSVLER